MLSHNIQVTSKLDMLEGWVLDNHWFLKLLGTKLRLEKALITKLQFISIQNFRQPWALAKYIDDKNAENSANREEPKDKCSSKATRKSLQPFLKMLPQPLLFVSVRKSTVTYTFAPSPSQRRPNNIFDVGSSRGVS